MASPEAPHDPPPGTLIDNRWRLLEQLASDGDAVAYKAEPLKGGKPVNLKLLDERCASSRELAARFDREARAISRVDHPHCVAILGFGIHRGRPYLVTPLLAGRRLSDEIGKAPLTPARVARVVGQLLEGLRHGHAHGVVHRSLSPDKILLVGNAGAPDQVKILDFGLARMLGSDEKGRVASEYLAPEQLRNGPIDQRADLYAVGVILRAMLPAEAASPSLQRVIARALAADPEQRFADAGEMLAALESTVERRAGLRRRAERGPRAPLGGAVVAALLLVAGGTVLWLRARAERARPTLVAAPTPPKPAPTPAPSPPPPTATPKVAAAPSTPPPPTVKPPAPSPSPSPPPIATPKVVAAPSPPAPSPPANDAVRARVEALVAEGKLDEAQAALRAELEVHAERAELHLELADVHYRRYWRNDTITEWDRALTLDPTLANDPRITTRLCAILGTRWKGAGAQLIERRLGRAALPAIVACAEKATDLARLQAAAELAERLGGKDAIDAQLVARRTLELSGKSAPRE